MKESALGLIEMWQGKLVSKNTEAVFLKFTIKRAVEKSHMQGSLGHRLTQVRCGISLFYLGAHIQTKCHIYFLCT